jgi:hypothetical protein
MEFWEIGSAVEDQKFIGVQSVLAFENKLYVCITHAVHYLVPF